MTTEHAPSVPEIEGARPVELTVQHRVPERWRKLSRDGIREQLERDRVGILDWLATEIHRALRP